MMETDTAMSYKNVRIAVSFTVVCAALLYALQVFTPLRLSSDGILYLTLADSAARNGFWTAFHQPGFPVPKGYPVFIFFLMKMGLFSSAMIVISNLLLFAAGLWFSFRVLLAIKVERTGAQIACLFTILSFCAVKFITQGMSDFLFFALSSCVCWLLTSANPYKWCGIAVCTISAIEVRFIGLALIAPLMFVALGALRQKTLALAIALGTALTILVAGIIAGHHYLASNVLILKTAGLWHFAVLAAKVHFQDFAEIVANVPLSKLPHEFRVPLLMMGSVALLIFLVGIVALRKRSPWLSVYLAAYSIMILPWPFTDPRFWLPAMPFVMLSFHEGLVFLFGKVPKRLVLGYGFAFCTLGVVALGYSTKLTFAGQKFAQYYGDGRLTSTYLTGCGPAQDTGEHDALVLLRRYQWHCRESQ
jgi:hypothetical protein